MQTKKIDPRIRRTRKLLIDAFNKLSTTNDFNTLTIQQISDEATVNRTTFYAHFQDKYDLLDAACAENVAENFVKKIQHFEQLDKETILQIFLTLTAFQHRIDDTLGIPQGSRSYESICCVLEQKIIKELEHFFHVLLSKRANQQQTPEQLKIGATVLSWGIYGAALDWEHNSTLPSEEYIHFALPYIFQDN